MVETSGLIVLAVDGSEGAIKASAFAGRAARATSSRLNAVIVHANPHSDLYENVVMALSDSPHKPAGMEGRASRTVAAPVFAKVRDCVGPGVTLETAELWGHPAEEICRFADEHRADVIIMGSRGHSAFKALLLGSVSLQVLAHAHCPVTVVR
ncbi:MAG: universal stress protein [Gammaproteobacteria bacterium]